MSNTCNSELIKKQIQVLVVEDDLSLEPIWNHIFSQLNFTVEFDWVYSFSEAERSLKNKAKNNSDYDLVLLDIFVYGSKCGIDFWGQYHELMNEKLIVMSSIEQSKIKGYLHANCDPLYIQKPINVDEIIKFLNQHLTQHLSKKSDPIVAA